MCLEESTRYAASRVKWEREGETYRSQLRRAAAKLQAWQRGIIVFDDGDIGEELEAEREAYFKLEQLPPIDDDGQESDYSESQSDGSESDDGRKVGRKRKSWSDADEEDDEDEDRPRQRRRNNSASVLTQVSASDTDVCIARIDIHVSPKTYQTRPSLHRYGHSEQ